MAGPLQAEAQAAGPIGGNQQAGGARLKGIHGTLALGRRDLAGEQLAAEPLLQQLGRSDKTAEQHHRFPLGQQLAHQGRGRRQFVVGADLAQGREHGQGLGIAPHLTEGHPTAVILDLALQPVLEAAASGVIQLDRHHPPLLGRQIQAILLAAMQEQGPGQALQLLELAGALGLPMAHTAPLQPVAVAVTLLKGPLVPGDRMADRGQEGKQLGRPAIFHRRARQQPGRPQARVAGQAQEGLGAGSRHVLGVVGLIGNQDRARRGQAPGQFGPAMQLQVQLQAGGLPAPMAVEPSRGQHHHPAIGTAHHRPGRHQRRERLAQAHGIGQEGAATGQQPAHRRPLVGKQAPLIRQGLAWGSGCHELAVGWQGRQGLVQPGQPLEQLRLQVKTPAQSSLEGTAGLQGKLPAAPAPKPVALGSDGPQLGLGDGIEWGDHLDRAGGTKPHQAPGRLSQGSSAPRLGP